MVKGPAQAKGAKRPALVRPFRAAAVEAGAGAPTARRRAGKEMEVEAGEAERTGRTGALTAADAATAGLREQTTAGTLGTSGDASRPTAGPAPPSPDTPDTTRLPIIMDMTEDHTIIMAPHIIPGMGAAAAAGIMEVIMVVATPVTSVLGGSPKLTLRVLAS